jgi:hypothetical protein
MATGTVEAREAPAQRLQTPLVGLAGAVDE